MIYLTNIHITGSIFDQTQHITEASSPEEAAGKALETIRQGILEEFALVVRDPQTPQTATIVYAVPHEEFESAEETLNAEMHGDQTIFLYTRAINECMDKIITRHLNNHAA